MCYNKSVSLLTFSVMAISTACLIYRNYPNDRWFALFFIFAGIMQLFEYFMWSDQSCGLVNHLATMGAFILLLMQPVVLLIGAYYFGTLRFDKKKLVPIIWTYVIFFGIIIINKIKIGIKHRMCSLPNGKHLDWNMGKLFFRDKPIMYLCAFLYYISAPLFLLARPWYLGAIMLVLTGGTLFFSVFFVKNPSWKSMWCWISNFIPVIYIILSYFIYKNRQLRKYLQQ